MSERATSTLPARAGIGLRGPHIEELLTRKPALAWLEVHSENYFGEGGRALRQLEAVRQDYALSLHGVGLSLGSTDPLSLIHLNKLKRLIARVDPSCVSEHLCWSSIGGKFLNDLLPLPYSEEALTNVCRNIQQAQDFLGRRLLIENVSSYIQFSNQSLTEWEFLAEVAQRSDCDILLDINNIYVSSVNHGFDASTYLAAIPVDRVAEIHLAGHESDIDEQGSDSFLIDTHSRPVCDAVWSLYADALARFGQRPTLIEWDSDLPALDDLLGEARKAQDLLDSMEPKHHARAA
jgi:uncharacterized protein